MVLPNEILAADASNAQYQKEKALEDRVSKLEKKFKKKKKSKPKFDKSTFAFITGCKSEKWPPQRTVDKHVRLIADQYRDNGFVLTGGSREIEKKVVRACKANKLRCLIYPANFEILSGASAEQLRNADIFRVFKPQDVILFSVKDIEKDSVLEHVVKLSLKAGSTLKKNVKGV